MCFNFVVDIFELETLYSFTVPLTILVVFEVPVFVVNLLKWCEIKISVFRHESHI